MRELGWDLLGSHTPPCGVRPVVLPSEARRQLLLLMEPCHAPHSLILQFLIVFWKTWFTPRSRRRH